MRMRPSLVCMCYVCVCCMCVRVCVYLDLRVYAPFRTQEPHFAGIRNLGLGLVNAAAPVKNQIMAYAMGL